MTVNAGQRGTQTIHLISEPIFGKSGPLKAYEIRQGLRFLESTVDGSPGLSAERGDAPLALEVVHEVSSGVDLAGPEP